MRRACYQCGAGGGSDEYGVRKADYQCGAGGGSDAN